MLHDEKPGGARVDVAQPSLQVIGYCAEVRRRDGARRGGGTGAGGALPAAGGGGRVVGRRQGRRPRRRGVRRCLSALCVGHAQPRILQGGVLTTVKRSKILPASSAAHWHQCCCTFLRALRSHMMQRLVTAPVFSTKDMLCSAPLDGWWLWSASCHTCCPAGAGGHERHQPARRRAC